MNFLFSNTKTKTVSRYFHIAIGCFFNDLLFYTGGSASAKFAEAFAHEKSGAQTLRRV